MLSYFVYPTENGNGNITQLKNNLHLTLIAIFDILAHLTKAQQLLGWKNVTQCELKILLNPTVHLRWRSPFCTPM